MTPVAGRLGMETLKGVRVLGQYSSNSFLFLPSIYDWLIQYNLLGINITSNSSNPLHLEHASGVAMIRTTAQLTQVRTTPRHIESRLI